MTRTKGPVVAASAAYWSRCPGRRSQGEKLNLRPLPSRERRAPHSTATSGRGSPRRRGKGRRRPPDGRGQRRDQPGRTSNPASIAVAKTKLVAAEELWGTGVARPPAVPRGKGRQAGQRQRSKSDDDVPPFGHRQDELQTSRRDQRDRGKRQLTPIDRRRLVAPSIGSAARRRRPAPRLKHWCQISLRATSGEAESNRADSPAAITPARALVKPRAEHRQRRAGQQVTSKASRLSR